MSARIYQGDICEVTKTSGLDANGFYAPGAWTDEQLAVFAQEIDPGGDGPIDSGIVRAVKLLMDHGVETHQSCEGGEDHSYPEPTIDFGGGQGAPWKALSICNTYGLPVSAIRRRWRIGRDGHPFEDCWQITFSQRLGPKSRSRNG
jgi:hypothetical protein